MAAVPAAAKRAKERLIRALCERRDMKNLLKVCCPDLFGSLNAKWAWGRVNSHAIF